MRIAWNRHVGAADDRSCAGMCALTGNAIAAGVIAAVAASLLGCGKPAAPPTTERAAAISVVTSAAAETTLTERLEAGGVVTATTSATIASRIAAPVISLRVHAGDRVRAGDLLVVLDDRDIAARVREADALNRAAEQALTAARAELVSATAEQKLAASWQQRIATLQAKDSATLQQLDEANARLASANARVDGAEAHIAQTTSQVAAARAAAEGAQTTQRFSAVRAPFNGVVTETLTDPGNLAVPGMPLLRIDAAGRQRVDVTIDESRAPLLHVGDHVDVVFDGSPAPRTVDGIVAEIGRAVATDRRAFTVKITLPANEAAPSGTFARVRFGGSTRKAVTIPSAGIRREGQVVTALAVEGDVARVRLLRIGDAANDRVEVLAGLDVGERVIIRPPSQVVDGTRVAATSPAPAGAGAP